MEAIFGNLGTMKMNLLLGDRRPTKAVWAPFHLGIPIDLCRTGKGKSATHSGAAVFADLRSTLEYSRFAPVAEELLEYDDNISVPMGRPLVLRDTANTFGEDAECFLALFSTGLFITIVLYFDSCPLGNIENYHEADTFHKYTAYGHLEESGRAFGNVLKEWVALKVKPLKPLFEAGNDVFLIDAYYLALHDSAATKSERISYINAVIPRQHATALLFTYASYYSILWLQKFLCGQVGNLKSMLLARHPAPGGMVETLKALGLHIRRLIAETSPYSIRITYDYVDALRRFRNEYGMAELEGAIVAQSDLIEDVVAWFDSQAKERLNNRIGIAATVLSFISISSVVAGLISTIDFANNQGAIARVWVILAGTAGTAGIILAGFLIAEWRRYYNGRK